MKRILLVLLLLLYNIVIGECADYSQQQTWVNGENITHTKLNIDIAGIINTINDLDADNIASTAAIPYSKLNLTGNIVNSDIGASAAIANTKLANPYSYFCISLSSDGQYTASLDPLRTFQMPFAATLVEVSVCARDIDTSSGNETYTIDLEEAGTSVLSSAISLTADNTPVVGTISDSAIADNAKMEVVLTLGGTTPTIDDITVLITYKVAHIN